MDLTVRPTEKGREQCGPHGAEDGNEHSHGSRATGAAAVGPPPWGLAVGLEPQGEQLGGCRVWAGSRVLGSWADAPPGCLPHACSVPGPLTIWPASHRPHDSGPVVGALAALTLILGQNWPCPGPTLSPACWCPCLSWNVHMGADGSQWLLLDPHPHLD